MFDAMKEEKFKIDNVEFSITKLDALSGWKMLESIRHQMSKTDITGAKTDDKQEGMQKFMSSILSLDPVFIDDLRLKLFANVQFKTKDVTTGWLPLTDTIDMAFADLEPSAIYEVLMRSLVVNFTRSFTEIISRLKSNGVNLKQPKP